MPLNYTGGLYLFPKPVLGGDGAEAVPAGYRSSLERGFVLHVFFKDELFLRRIILVKNGQSNNFVLFIVDDYKMIQVRDES